MATMAIARSSESSNGNHKRWDYKMLGWITIKHSKIQLCQSGYWVSTFVGQNELDFLAKVRHSSLEFIVLCRQT